MSRLLALLFAATLALTACATDSPDGAANAAAAAGTDVAGDDESAATAGQLSVVVSTTILGDLVTDLVDGAAGVEVLLPPGADPHEFALSAGQAETMRNADLLVVNGGNLEEGLIDAVEAAEEDGVHVFEATSAIDTIEFGATTDEHGHDEEEHAEDEHGHDEEEEHGHDHSGGDPHFWHDPIRVAEVVEALAAELAELDDTLEDSEWTARAEAMHEQLEALDTEVRDILSAIPEQNRVLVTNHDALGYLADAYDFTVAGTVIPGGSTLAEPSAADLEDLIDVVADTGVPAVFTETTESSRLAEVVAEEVGQDVAVFDLHTDALSEADGPAATYADFMRANAQTLVDALG